MKKFEKMETQTQPQTEMQSQAQEISSVQTRSQEPMRAKMTNKTQTQTQNQNKNKTKTKNSNPMREIKIEKVTLNIGAGKDQSKLDKGIKLLQTLTGVAPIKTKTTKRIPTWGLRPGLPIGCKVTLRRKSAEEVLKRILESLDFLLRPSQFDNLGNISFGITEYIDIPEMKYDPEIGVLGLQICVTLQRAGFRIKRRRKQTMSIGPRHQITKQEAIDFMKTNFKVKINEEN